jgi:hypothetical protein
MSYDERTPDVTSVGPQPDERHATPTTRQPWETPRVLAHEPFDRTEEVVMDSEPVEGDFYGPTS